MPFRGCASRINCRWVANAFEEVNIDECDPIYLSTIFLWYSVPCHFDLRPVQKPVFYLMTVINVNWWIWSYLKKSLGHFSFDLFWLNHIKFGKMERYYSAHFLLRISVYLRSDMSTWTQYITTSGFVLFMKYITGRSTAISVYVLFQNSRIHLLSLLHE